jgi:hypothetical protein
VVNSDEDVFYMKIDLQKILHMWQTSYAGLGEISFAKFGLQDGCSGVLSLDIGIAIICDRNGLYVYVMHVCNFFMTRMSRVWQYGWSHMYCQN